MTVRHTYTYSCDVKDCPSAPVAVEQQVHFSLPVVRPTAPNGWQYLDQFGLICDQHKVQFTVAPRLPAGPPPIEPGHE